MKKVFLSTLAASFLGLSACGQAPMPVAFQGAAPQLGALRAPAPGLSAASTSKAAGTMRVATYNIRNLFDGIPNANAAEGWTERPKPEKELVALSESLHDINADVIGFQEVESLQVLTQFRDKYLRDMGYQHVVLVEGNDRRGIDVALFSRFPVSNVKSHKDLRFPVPGQGTQGFSRDLLQARINAPNNYKFTMFVAHLKSQHGDDPADIKREAEALQIQNIIGTFQKANPQENFVLLGDFNDRPEAKHISHVVNPRVSNLNLSDIIMEEMGAQPWVYTYHPKKYRSRIDYILMSQTMKREYIPKSVKLYKPFKEGNEWKKLYFYNASDHIPVTVDFNITQDK